MTDVISKGEHPSRTAKRVAKTLVKSFIQPVPAHDTLIKRWYIFTFPSIQNRMSLSINVQNHFAFSLSLI